MKIKCQLENGELYNWWIREGTLVDSEATIPVVSASVPNVDVKTLKGGTAMLVRPTEDVCVEWIDKEGYVHKDHFRKETVYAVDEKFIVA